MWRKSYRIKVPQVKVLAKDVKRLMTDFRSWFRFFFSIKRIREDDVIVTGAHTKALDDAVEEVLGSLKLDADAKKALYLRCEIGNHAVEDEMVTFLPLSRVREGQSPIKFEDPYFPIFVYAVASSKCDAVEPAERLARAHVILDVGRRMWHCLRRNEYVHAPNPADMVQAIIEGRRAEHGVGAVATRVGPGYARERKRKTARSCPAIKR